MDTAGEVIRTEKEERRYNFLETYKLWRKAADNHEGSAAVDKAWVAYCEARDAYLFSDARPKVATHNKFNVRPIY